MSEPLDLFINELNKLMPKILKEFIHRDINELYMGKVTLVQLLILNFLKENPLSSMSDLASYLKVSTPAMTGLVERLVKAGYVLRIDDPKDRRIIRVKLTLKGSSLVEKINQKRSQMLKEIFSKISPKERQDYLGVLKHILAILTEKEK